MSASKSRPLWKKLLLGGLYVTLLGLLLIGATFAGWIGKSEAVRGVISGMIGEKPQTVFNDQVLTLLLLGCDEDRVYKGGVTKSAARSDIMLLARLDFTKKTIAMLSIPRDIRVRPESLGISIPIGRGEDRISHLKMNGFHAHGGPEMAQEAIQNLLGIKVDRTIVINYQAFQELIDQVGGVEVYVEKPMKYEDKAGELFIDLPKGRQRLNGYQAMGFVRYRKGDGESDFTRQDRQKGLLLAIKDEVLAKPTIIPSVADKAVDVLDKKLSGRELGSLIWFASRVPSSSVKLGQVPVEEHRTRRLYYQEVDRRKLPERLAEFGFTEGRT